MEFIKLFSKTGGTKLDGSMTIKDGVMYIRLPNDVQVELGLLSSLVNQYLHCTDRSCQRLTPTMYLWNFVHHTTSFVFLERKSLTQGMCLCMTKQSVLHTNRSKVWI